ncbi:hypothetical protein [Tannerella forsythia]|uniref:Uncharacterized protein n=1 Tax=Tannerella forsythia TaxID=28112 RepID=A0A3P1YZJ0_TANFO|nr:hypothetical protein [Tannerella forsythia]RRD75256.1 hypothetical protein EII41_07020 [Tannerella forsythia]
MSNYSYRILTKPARLRIEAGTDKAGGQAREIGGSGSGSGSTGSGSAPGASANSFVAGDRIQIDANKSVIKISHEEAKEENKDSQTLNEKGYFVKCLHLDKQGHIVKVETEEIAGTFDDRYLRKDKPDETNFKITFLQGADFGHFVEGFLGSGGRIDENGNCWFGGMRLRDFLEVPELRFNRIDVVSGELWNSIAFGLIEDVDTANRIVTLKLEEGERSGLHVNDFCRGLFHNLTGNETTAGVDACGFDKLPGFSTSYFMPVQILDNKRFKYNLKPGTTVHPCKAMKFAVYGNATDKARQSSAYHTRNYVRYLCDVDTWEIKPQHIGVQMGDLSGLVIDGENLGRKSIYLDNVYFGKNILQTPGLKESLKGKDAYTVGLDRYSQAYNSANGGVNQITFTAFASKGGQPLAFSTVSGEGKFTLSVKSVSGCTVAQAGASVRFTSFSSTSTGTVVVTVNCEGLVSYQLSFVATRVADGSPGDPGKKGDVVRSVYRRSASQPGYPQGNPPFGWQFDPFAGTNPLWMSQATFNAAGEVVTSWSYPVRITGDAGLPGTNGTPGPMPSMRGTWDSNKTYNGSSFFVDVVMYNNRYYRAKPNAGVFSGVHPSNPNKWELLNSFENVATKLLIAEEANIAGWLFNKNYILSQNRNVGMDGSADNKPRFWAGSGYAGRDNAPFRVYENGTIVAKEGQIGGFMIREESLTNTSGHKVNGAWTGLQLSPWGFIHLSDSNNNRSAMMTHYSSPVTQNALLTLRVSREDDGVPAEFFNCFYSASGSLRGFCVTAQNLGDASWYRRICITASHMPHRNQAVRLPKWSNSDINDPEFYEVLWDRRSGTFVIGNIR